MDELIHFFEVDDGKDIIEQSVLQSAVGGRIGRHGRTTVDLDEPRFEGSVEHDVKPVEFKTPLIVGDNFTGGD